MAGPLRIIIAPEHEFLNNYWTFSMEEVHVAVKKALGYFRRTFPDVQFNPTFEVRSWDAKRLPRMRDFPLSLLLNLPACLSLEEALQVLEQRYNEAGFSPDPKAWESIRGRIQKDSKSAQFWYLMGFWDFAYVEELVLDLREKLPARTDEFVLGFTGNLFVLERDLGGCLGVALLGQQHAVFPIQYKRELWRVVLHEIGHLFGAEHPEDDKVNSIMNRYGGKTFRFDAPNQERIRKRIAAL